MNAIIIEESFRRAYKVGFIFTEDYNTGPSAIILIVESPEEANKGYRYLLEEKEPITLLVRTNENKMALSFIPAKSTQVANVSDLEYNSEEHRKFADSLGEQKYYAFLLGDESEGEVKPFMPPNERFLIVSIKTT